MLVGLLHLKRIRLSVDGAASRVCSLLIMWLPEVLLSVRRTLDPGRQNATRKLVSPRVLEVLVGGLDATTRSLLDQPDGGVDEDVGDDAGNQAVGDAVGERHHADSQESGDRVAHVAPVDFCCCFHHHGSDDDERASGSPGWDRSENGGEENGDEEAETGRDCSETSGTTFGDTGTGLDEGSDGRASKERTDGDTECIDQVCDGRALKVLSLLVDGASKASHRVHSSSAVKNVDV